MLVVAIVDRARGERLSPWHQRRGNTVVVMVAVVMTSVDNGSASGSDNWPRSGWDTETETSAQWRTQWW